MKHCCGSMSLSSVLGVAGVLAVGVAGYSFLTGNSLCGMFGKCDKSAAAARLVADAEQPSACPMAGGAKVAHAAGEGHACAASATADAASHSECTAGASAANDSPAGASECPYMKAHQVVAASTSSECPMSSKTCAAQASGCSDRVAAASPLPKSRVRWTFAAGGTFGAPLVMPVFFSECGAVTFDGSAKDAAVTEEVVAVNASLVESADHSEAAACCKAGGVCPHDPSACPSAGCDKANCPKAEAAKTEKSEAKPAAGE